MPILTVNFLGIPFVSMPYQDIINCIKEAMEQNKPLKICFMDEKRLFQTFFSKKVQNNLRLFDMIIPSSIFLYKEILSIYKDYRYNYHNHLDLVSPLLEEYQHRNIQFMFFSSSAEQAYRLKSNLQVSFPSLRLMGCYSKKQVETITDDLRLMIPKADVRILFLGMRTPYDEIWVENNYNILDHCVSICLDTSLQYLTTHKKKYEVEGQNKKKVYFKLDCFYKKYFIT